MVKERYFTKSATFLFLLQSVGLSFLYRLTNYWLYLTVGQVLVSPVYVIDLNLKHSSISVVLVKVALLFDFCRTNLNRLSSSSSTFVSL